jgi:hypothetical protein
MASYFINNNFLIPSNNSIKIQPGHRLAPSQFNVKTVINPTTLVTKTRLKLAAGMERQKFFFPYVPCVSASYLQALPVPLPEIDTAALLYDI